MKCPNCRHGFLKLLRSKCPYCKSPLDPKKWTTQKQQGSRDDYHTNYALMANPHAPMTGAVGAPQQMFSMSPLPKKGEIQWLDNGVIRHSYVWQGSEWVLFRAEPSSGWQDVETKDI